MPFGGSTHGRENGWTLNFGYGPAKKYVAAIDPANADLLRTVIGWWLYGPNGARGYRGLKTRFDQMRRLFVLCTQEGILASELSHFPARSPEPVSRRCSRLPGPVSSWHCCTNCTSGGMRWGSPCWIAQGWHASQRPCPRPPRSSRPPISPPRIWHYQITRLRECLDDFLAHRGQVEECFRFCLAAYRHNSASLQDNAGHNRSIRFSGRRMDQTEVDWAAVLRPIHRHRASVSHGGTIRRWLGVSDDENPHSSSESLPQPRESIWTGAIC